jgi:hypothetical protein
VRGDGHLDRGRPEKLIDCAQLAEEIVGHPLPGKVLRAGSLKRFRDAALAA